jgi:hypothetical protein
MKWQESGSEFERPPTGSHLARCFSLIDLGTHTTTWQGKEKQTRQVKISFELSYENMTGRFNPDMAGEPFTAVLLCTQSLSEKAKLRKMLEGWRGKKFSHEELQGYHPRKLLGQPCRLSLVESESGFVGIDSIARVTKNEIDTMPPMKARQLYFSLEPDEFEQRAFEALNERTQLKIMETPEWKALQEAYTQEPVEEEPPVDYNEVPF